MNTSDSIARRLEACAKSGITGDVITVTVTKDENGNAGFETYINPMLAPTPALSHEMPHHGPDTSWEQINYDDIKENNYIGYYYVTEFDNFCNTVTERAEDTAFAISSFIGDHERYAKSQENVGATIVSKETTADGKKVYRLSNGETIPYFSINY